MAQTNLEGDLATAALFARYVKPATLNAYGVGARVADLVKAAASLHTLAEADCNRGLTPRQEARERSLQKRCTALVTGMVPRAKVRFGGDPRGFVVVVDFPPRGGTAPANGFGPGWGIR